MMMSGGIDLHHFIFAVYYKFAIIINDCEGIFSITSISAFNFKFICK